MDDIINLIIFVAVIGSAIYKKFAGKDKMLEYVVSRGVEADLRMGGQAELVHPRRARRG